MNEDVLNEGISEEIALSDFDRMLSAADVEWDDFVLTFGKAANSEKHRIVKAIKNGRVSIDDNGFPTIHTSSDHEKLSKIKVFREAMRADILAMDRIKTPQGYDNSNAKEDAALGNFVKVDRILLGTLRTKDYKLLYAVWTIFLGD